MKRSRLIGLCLATVFVLCAVAVSSASAKPKALIDEATVSGGTSSQEAAIAAAQGFEVAVVSDATWGSMTQTEFGNYQLLIAGDPTCGSLPSGLITSASVYGPVVLGLAGGRTQAGNRIVVGTDPVFHDGGDYTSPGARGTIIRQGIGFAGAQAGRTGMYFDSTCGANYSGQSEQTLEILTHLSSGSPAWTIDAEPPCGGNVSLIASNPSFSELTTESLQGWECSVHESFPTFPSDWSALAVATDTTSHPTCGVDPNTNQSACGEAYVLIAGSGIVVRSESIELTPTNSSNPEGTDHTVTALVTGEGSPLSGQAVTFTVTGQNAGATGTCVPATCKTNASGEVTFTYHDGKGAGEDTIKASFTDASGSLQSATAVKHWVAGRAPTCKLTKTGTDGTGHKYIEVTMQDTGSGLASINVDKSQNANTAIPAFAVGTTSPVVATSTKIVQSKTSVVQLTVTNVAGRKTVCDPATVLARPRPHGLASQNLRLPAIEHRVTISNGGSPGLTRLDVTVGGRTWKLRLSPGQRRTLSVTSGLPAGASTYTMTLTPRGKPGTSAFVLVSE